MAEDIRKKLLEKPCSLMGYSEPWDSAALAIVLAQRSKFDLMRVTIVTWNPSIAIKTLNNSTLSDKETKIIEYNGASELMNLESSLVVFDSLQELELLSGTDELGTVKVGLNILPHLIKKRNIVIILFTMGVLEKSFINLRSVVPGVYSFWATFVDRYQHLQFVLHETNMTSDQEIIYSSVRNKEIKDNNLDVNLGIKGTDTSFYESQKICNILLPRVIQGLMGTPEEPLVDSMMDMYTRVVPKVKQDASRVSNIRRAIFGSSTKITETESIFDMDEFLLNAPKIKDLISQLYLFADMRHVIYTRYERHYGAMMLERLLKLKGFKVYLIIKTMTTESQLDTLKLFNLETNPGILITDTHMPGTEGINNISHLHFLDSGYEMYSILMEQIYKYRLYKSSLCNLVIHNYVCNKKGTNPSADKILFDNFLAYLKTTLDTMEIEKSKCHPVVVGRTTNGHLATMSIKKK